MTTRADAVCLLSLNSDAYTSDTIAEVIREAERLGGRLLFVCLDALEEINAKHLGEPQRGPEFFMSGVLKSVVPSRANYAVASDLEREPVCREYLNALEAEFIENKTFRNSCATQVFRSLQPKLAAIGIKNQRHPIVTALSRYVVRELALLAYLHQARISHEISFHSDILAKMYIRRETRSIKFPAHVLIGRPHNRGDLSIEGLTVAIPGERIVGPLSFRVRPGTITGLIGPNGCGKSTALRAIAGHLKPVSGRVVLAGRDVSNTSPQARGVATVFQDGGLFPHLDVEMNMKAGARLAKSRRPSFDVDIIRYLERFKVVNIANRMPSEISGGEMQITAVGRALASGPRLLLLDEPTASLDQVRKRELAALLVGMVRRLSIPCLLVSHDREFLFTTCDNLVTIDSNGDLCDTAYLNGSGGLRASLQTVRLLGQPNLFVVNGGDQDRWLSFAGSRVAVVPEAASGSAVAAILPPDKIQAVATGDCDGDWIIIAGHVRRISSDGSFDYIFVYPDATERCAEPGLQGLILLTCMPGKVRVEESAFVRLGIRCPDVDWLLK